MAIDALSVLCAQLMRDLLSTAEFLFPYWHIDSHENWHTSSEKNSWSSSKKKFDNANPDRLITYRPLL